MHTLQLMQGAVYVCHVLCTVLLGPHVQGCASITPQPTLLLLPLLPLLHSVPLKGAATCESAANSSPSEQADCGAAEAALVGAANYALENTAVALTYMLVPPLLKPVVWRLLAAAPPPRMRELNAARRKLFGAAETLAANAVRRLGLVWEDDIGMAAAFGACGV
jgi:hypothetical protein